MVDARIEHIPEDWLGASELNTGSPAGGDSGQFVAQLVGIATLVGFVLPFAYGLTG